MEERALNPQGLALVATAAAYLFLRPGVLPGAIDTYLKAPLQRARSKVYGKVGAGLAASPTGCRAVGWPLGEAPLGRALPATAPSLPRLAGASPLPPPAADAHTIGKHAFGHRPASGGSLWHRPSAGIIGPHPTPPTLNPKPHQTRVQEDFDMGRKLASGGFGTVYKAELVVDEEGTRREVIVKKATEFGEAEVRATGTQLGAAGGGGGGGGVVAQRAPCFDAMRPAL